MSDPEPDLQRIVEEMMPATVVYVVEHNEGHGVRWINAVFSTHAAAEVWIEQQDDRYDLEITRHDVDGET